MAADIIGIDITIGHTFSEITVIAIMQAAVKLSLAYVKLVRIARQQNLVI
jgi:hypothetical protein